MRRILTVILLSLLVGSALARSKHPTPSHGKNESRIPQTHTENSQQPSTTDQRGTEQSPVVVKIIGAEPKAQNRANNSTDQAQTKPPADWWGIAIGGGTLFVLGLQLIAFGVQACYMRRSTNEMRRTTHATIRAARAAQKSANAASPQAKIAEAAFIQLERPYIFIFDVKEFHLDGETSEFFVEYSVANYGKMPAIRCLHRIQI